MAKKFQVCIRTDYCKACEICIYVCPTQVLSARNNGKAQVSQLEKCIGCKLCEYHCPDFAITVTGEAK